MACTAFRPLPFLCTFAGAWFLSAGLFAADDPTASPSAGAPAVSAKQPAAPLASDSATPATSLNAWPSFRGDGTSTTPAAQLPLHWDDKQHIAWRVKLDDYGQSSPVIHSGLIFTTSVEGENKDAIRVDAHRLSDGSRAWKRSFTPTQPGPSDGMHSRAAPTPVVDDAGVYAWFETGDLIALTLDGKPRWQRDLATEYGKVGGRHGIGGSLVQTRDAVIVLVADSSVSYLVSIDKATGKTNWHVEREKAVAWTTPTVAEYAGEVRIYVSVNGSLAAYRAADGKQVWAYADALKGNTVASPTVAGDVLLVGTSDKTSCIAVKRGLTGTVSKEQGRAWLNRRAESSFGSPLAYRGMAYYVNRPGEVRCINVASGEERWAYRLPASVWASPVGAGDRVYFFGSTGTTTVLPAEGSDLAFPNLDPEADSNAPAPLAQNTLTLGEGNKLYGVAIVDRTIIVRTGVELICIREAE